MRVLTALALTLAGVGALTGPSATAEISQAGASISVSLTKPNVIVGQQTVVKGRVTPAKPTTRVRLQQKVSGGWKNLSRQQVTATGRYRFTVAPQSGGTFRYRVIRLPWRPEGTLTSRTVRVTAYRWIDVTTTVSSWVEWEGLSAFGEPAAINGVTYPGSIVIDATTGGPLQGGYVEIDLEGHRCAVFEATLGTHDDTDDGAEISTVIEFDGLPIEEDSYGVGDSDHRTLNVLDATSLRVSAFVADDELGAFFGIGSPRLLCAT